MKEIKNQIKKYYDFWFGMNNIYEIWAKKHNLTYYSLFALYIIKENSEYCTQKIICDQLLLPKQTVNTILNSFEKNGYVKRIVNESDKRNKIIVFTESGQVYSDTILEEMYDFEKKAMLKMNSEERAKMTEYNDSLLACFNKVFKELKL